jgi:hypothetical protein
LPTDIGETLSNKLKSQLSKKTLSSSQSSNSLFSSSGTATYNEDDYFTAEDSEDNDGNSSSRLKYTKNQNTGKVLTKNLSSSSNLNGFASFEFSFESFINWGFQ